MLQSLMVRGTGPAVLISALLFGILHGIGFPSSFLFGLVAGLLTIKYHSLLPAMIVHVANNLTLWFISRFLECPFCRYPLLTWIILLAVLVLSGWLIRRDIASFLRWAKEATSLSRRQVQRELVFTFKHAIPLFLLLMSLTMVILSYHLPAS